MYKDAQPVVAGNGREDAVGLMQGWGEGARAEVKVLWDGGCAGHVFAAEVLNGEVRFLDPQNGNMDCSDYFDDVARGSVELLRVDDLEFTDRIYDCFTET
jgi:hypothetical protein